MSSKITHIITGITLNNKINRCKCLDLKNNIFYIGSKNSIYMNAGNGLHAKIYNIFDNRDECKLQTTHEPICVCNPKVWVFEGDMCLRNCKKPYVVYISMMDYKQIAISENNSYFLGWRDNNTTALESNIDGNCSLETGILRYRSFTITTKTKKFNSVSNSTVTMKAPKEEKNQIDSQLNELENILISQKKQLPI